MTDDPRVEAVRDQLREMLGALIRYPSVYMGGYWNALHKGDQRRVDDTITGILALPPIAEALAADAAAVRKAALEEAARVAEVSRGYADGLYRDAGIATEGEQIAAVIRALADAPAGGDDA